jgi:hypothetical protein
MLRVISPVGEIIVSYVPNMAHPSFLIPWRELYQFKATSKGI